jgi:hypothetical protein
VGSFPVAFTLPPEQFDERRKDVEKKSACLIDGDLAEPINALIDLYSELKGWGVCSRDIARAVVVDAKRQSPRASTAFSQISRTGGRDSVSFALFI